jgi:ribosome-associated protein
VEKEEKGPRSSIPSQQHRVGGKASSSADIARVVPLVTMTGSSRTSPPRGPGSFTIPEYELAFSFARSGGPGGQNVNKVETKVTVTFDFSNSTALTWEQKGRLGNHPSVVQNLNAEGCIAITSQAHRSQALNREDAIERLHELVRQALRPRRKRIPTRKTKASQRKRVDEKKVRGRSKATRRRVDPYTDD